MDAYNQFSELYAQGCYAEAEPLYDHSLANREKAVGPDRPEVGTSLNNQGELYRAQCHYAKAEPSIQLELGIADSLTVRHVQREGRRRP